MQYYSRSYNAGAHNVKKLQFGLGYSFYKACCYDDYKYISYESYRWENGEWKKDNTLIGAPCFGSCGGAGYWWCYLNKKETQYGYCNDKKYDLNAEGLTNAMGYTWNGDECTNSEYSDFNSTTLNVLGLCINSARALEAETQETESKHSEIFGVASSLY